MSARGGRHHRVGDVARLSGVTVRTLHHYDRIGLLVPAERSAAGYRVYRDEDLLRLQQILVWRELGLALDDICKLLDQPDDDRREALLRQRAQLVERKERYGAMIRSVDAALTALEGETIVDAKELFDGFDPAAYEEEVKERWGQTEAYRESARRTRGYGKQDWARIRESSDDIYRRLATMMQGGTPPDHDDVAALVEEHRLHIDRWFYPCSHEQHRGLAETYVGDPRFAASIDQHGTGLARYLAAAIQAQD